METITVWMPCSNSCRQALTPQASSAIPLSNRTTSFPFPPLPATKRNLAPHIFWHVIVQLNRPFSTEESQVAQWKSGYLGTAVTRQAGRKLNASTSSSQRVPERRQPSNAPSSDVVNIGRFADECCRTLLVVSAHFIFFLGAG